MFTYLPTHMYRTDQYQEVCANSNFMVCFSPLSPQMCFDSRNHDYHEGMPMKRKWAVCTHTHVLKHLQYTFSKSQWNSMQIQLYSYITMPLQWHHTLTMPPFIQMLLRKPGVRRVLFVLLLTTKTGLARGAPPLQWKKMNETRNRVIVYINGLTAYKCRHTELNQHSITF